jgi:HK97 family phage prohead protease
MYQFKHTQAEIKDLDLKQGIITSYWSRFDIVDSDEDFFTRSAWDKSISERGPSGSNRIMFLWQHNPTMPLGKPMELYTDESGLIGVTKISDTTYGMDAIKLYRDGVINEHSVGFQTIKGNYDDDRKGYAITEAKLWEGSAVTWGANEFTPVISGKGMDKTKALSYYQTLCKAFYTGDYTDDTFRILEAQKNHFEQIFTKSLETNEPTAQVTPEPNQADAIKNVITQFKLQQQFRSI